jgi:hypothetical protein
MSSTRCLAASIAAAGALLSAAVMAEDPPAAEHHGHHHHASPPLVEAPVPGHPVRFYSVGGDQIHALMKDHSVRAIPSGKTLLEITEEHGWTIGNTFCATATGDKAACIYLATKTESSGNQSTTYKRLMLVDGEHSKTIGQGSGDRYDIGALGIHFLSDGKILYAFSETERQGDAVVEKSWMVTGGEKAPFKVGSASLLARLANIGAGDRVDPPIQFVEFKGNLYMVYRDGEAIQVKPIDGKAVEAAKRSLHDIRAVTTSDGWFYILYHDAGENTANMAKSQDGETWSRLELDSKESGWQMEAVAHGDQVVCVFYYMRNTYNKGLRAVFLKDGGFEHRAFTIVREEAYNTGWHPNLGIASDGTTWLTWLQNVEDGKRVWSKLGAAEELNRHEVKGGTGWEEDYKDYFLQTGIGGWYTWWVLKDMVPNQTDPNGVKLGRTSYNVGGALLTSANLEARWKSFNLGASYAQSVIDDASKAIGDSSGVLNGQIKIDDLLLGHDLKLAFLWGRYRGKATRGDGYDVYQPDGEPELPIKTNFIDVQVLLLNKWRIKYGFDFQTYAVPASLHAWYAGEGSTAYEYKGSYFRNVSFQHFNVILGYSKLDYAAKYENRYNDIFLDGAVSAGYSRLSFSPVTVLETPTDPANSATLSEKGSASTFNVRVMAQLGWLYFQRWKSAHGLGMYVRPAYMADFGYMGSAGKPGDRKSEDAKSASTIVNAGISSLRHGPWLDLGIVW